MTGSPHPTMTCEQAERLLAHLLFGEPAEAGEESRRLQDHLTSCPACRERLADMRLATGWASQAMTVEPTPRLSPERRAALLEAVAHRGPAVLVLRIPVRGLAIAASVAVVGIVLWAAVLALDPSTGPKVAYRDAPGDSQLSAEFHREQKLADASLLADGPLPAESLEARRERQDGSIARGWALDRGGETPRRLHAVAPRPADAPLDQLPQARRRPSAEPSVPNSGAAVGNAEAEQADTLSDDLSRPSSPAAGPEQVSAPPAASTVARPHEAQAFREVGPRSELPPSRLFRESPIAPNVPTRSQPSWVIALMHDTASFDLARRYLRAGYLPPPGSVRAEAFVNALRVADPPEDSGIAVRTTVEPHPFHADLWLAKIDVAARSPRERVGESQAPPVAQDLKMRIELDPAHVAEYRPIGYEDHLLREVPGPAGIGGGGALRDGQSIAVLFELRLTHEDKIEADTEWGTVTIRYRSAITGELQESTQVLTGSTLASPGGADPRFQLAAAAATWAQTLRGGPVPQAAIAHRVERIAASLPDDPSAAELLELVRKGLAASPAP